MEELPAIFNSTPTSNQPEAQILIPSELLTFFSVALAALLLCGVCGNLLSIIALLLPRKRLSSTSFSRTPQFPSRTKSMTVTNAYIFNLSAADLAFLLFCAPFQGTVYIYNRWPYGWFVCKFAHYSQYCTMYASVWILTLMSVDRYFCIGYPLKSVKWRRVTHAKTVSAIVWLTACCISAPWLFFYDTTELTTSGGTNESACYDDWPDKLYQYRKWMFLAVFVLGFFVPAVVIFTTAILISQSIRCALNEPLLTTTANGKSSQHPRISVDSGSSFMSNNQLSQREQQTQSRLSSTAAAFKRRRRVRWLVFALCLVFFVCWLPHHISILWLNFDHSAQYWVEKRHETFFVLRLTSHALTYLNAVMNPILYGMASNRMSRLLATLGLMSRRSPGDKQCRILINDRDVVLTERQSFVRRLTGSRRRRLEIVRPTIEVALNGCHFKGHYLSAQDPRIRRVDSDRNISIESPIRKLTMSRASSFTEGEKIKFICNRDRPLKNTVSDGRRTINENGDLRKLVFRKTLMSANFDT